MSRFSILLGGEITVTPALRAAVAGTRVIAADWGIRHASALGLVPELWVGDFDSVSETDIAAHEEIPRAVYPPEKDQTDGELAIDAALKEGATSLVMVGAFGGARADHTYLHLAQALTLAERGLSAFLTSGSQEGRPLLPGKHRFDYAEGTLFSLLAFSELTGLTVTGAQWPLDSVTVPFGSSLTLSNRVTGRLGIELGGGRALLIAHVLPEAEG
jgi:thiamine pyrophosphokinase